MKNITIVTATEKELAGLEKYKNLENNKIDKLITGIGKEKAIKKIKRYWSDNEFDILINAGICGSLDNRFKTGDIIYPEYVSIYSESKQVENIRVNKDSIVKDSADGLITVKNPVKSKAKKLRIKKKFQNCVAVDMESYPLAKFCKDKGKEFKTIKVVSDNAIEVDPKYIKNNVEFFMKKLALKLETIITGID